MSSGADYAALATTALSLATAVVNYAIEGKAAKGRDTLLEGLKSHARLSTQMLETLKEGMTRTHDEFQAVLKERRK
ncbi:MAG TPA: hypothetical protein VFQ85_11435 [Mycobacteriales bacterium]|jgi:hypothetical protein|nr:hypothetical protein [Mycobacteriales bacterium]